MRAELLRHSFRPHGGAASNVLADYRRQNLPLPSLKTNFVAHFSSKPKTLNELDALSTYYRP